MDEEKFNALVEPYTGDLMTKLRKEENLPWLDKSALIAFDVLQKMDELGINKMQLSLMLKVSPSYITKLLKGQQNLTLETIIMLEKALSIKILGADKSEKKDLIYSKTFTHTCKSNEYSEVGF